MQSDQVEATRPKHIFGKSADIRARLGNTGGCIVADPIIRSVAGINSRIKAVVIDAKSMPGDAKSFIFFNLQI